MTNTLEQDIVELREIADNKTELHSLAKKYVKSQSCVDFCVEIAKQALFIIEKLQEERENFRQIGLNRIKITDKLKEERDRYKHLWETDSAQAREIMDELEAKNTQLSASKKFLTYENQEYRQAIKYISSSDESGQVKTNKAFEVLKRFGKL